MPKTENEPEIKKLPKSSQETMFYRKKGAEARIAMKRAPAEFHETAKEESSKKLKAVVAEVAVERSTVTEAYNGIMKGFGERTPAEIISSITEQAKDPASANERISELADSILKNLKKILLAIKILEHDIDITVTRHEEFKQLPGIYSTLKTEYQSALAAVTGYIEYWEYVRQNSAMPPFYKWGLSKYNKRKISYAMNTIFVAEEHTAKLLLKGLDILYSVFIEKKPLR
jgi:hypothetical protein